MKINEIKNLKSLKQVGGAINCLCLIIGGDSYPRPAKDLEECKLSCCLPISLYVTAYSWDNQKYNCSADIKQLRSLERQQFFSERAKIFMEK